MQQKRLEALDEALAGRHIAWLDAPAAGPVGQIRAIRGQGLLGYDGICFLERSCAMQLYTLLYRRQHFPGFVYDKARRPRNIRTA